LWNRFRIGIKNIFFCEKPDLEPNLSLSLSQFPFMCGIGIGIDIFEKKD
jgi:hypothetical protein